MGLVLERLTAGEGIDDAPPGRLRRLTLTEFRNHARTDLELDGRPVVLTGPNGAGKTNVLEAISLLSPGRGLRAIRAGEASRDGGGPWAVAATVDTEAGPVAVGTGIGRDERGDKRLVRIDGAAGTMRALAEHLRIAWLTPQMDRLFVDGASDRRRFLDRLVFGHDPAHARRVSAYEKAVRERQAVLREGRRDPAWLDAIERQIAGHGIAVALARVAGIARLNGTMAAATGPFPQAVLSLAGEPEGMLAAGGDALEAERRLLAALAANRVRDGESGTTSAGPHRSDLVAVHGGTGRAAPQCSTGEQKALLIAIILADARAARAASGRHSGDGGRPAPVLLLDEVVAHLDSLRRTALFDALTALGLQAFLTGTDAALFAGLDAQHFQVQGGLVRVEAAHG
ncbi:DNA replication/repair protein RecF [Zavarzinia sp. CC-PAN008]|uniref:DNA replication/repair protein RecF n=1 Tax=Zavarzinia sp. CC-PAN008 TaxID=3243332 RepID=UPI003F748182